jgi:hypothetical protein
VWREKWVIGIINFVTGAFRGSENDSPICDALTCWAGLAFSESRYCYSSLLPPPNTGAVSEVHLSDWRQLFQKYCNYFRLSPRNLIVQRRASSYGVKEDWKMSSHLLWRKLLSVLQLPKKIIKKLISLHWAPSFTASWNCSQPPLPFLLQRGLTHLSLFWAS